METHVTAGRSSTMKYLLAIALFLAPVAKAEGIDTFSFLPQTNIPSFSIPASTGPIFSVRINGVVWNFEFTQGDVFADAAYTDLFVSSQSGQNEEIVFPYFCDQLFNPRCIEVGKPWDGQRFVPGDYISMTITEVTTPEPSTFWLLGVGCVGGLLALLWSRKA